MAWKKIDLYTAQINPLWKKGCAISIHTFKGLLVLGCILDLGSLSTIDMEIKSKSTELIVKTPDMSIPTIFIYICILFLLWFPKPAKHPKTVEVLIGYIFIKKIILIPLVFYALKDYINFLNVLVTITGGLLGSLVVAIILFIYSKISRDYRLNHKLEVKI